MRLPIYRHLSQRLEIFGLSPLELGILSGVFIVLNEVMPRIRFGSFLILVACFSMALLLRYLHRRFEANYLEKFVRYVSLPDRLDRKLIMPHQTSRGEKSEKA